MLCKTFLGNSVIQHTIILNLLIQGDIARRKPRLFLAKIDTIITMLARRTEHSLEMQTGAAVLLMKENIVHFLTIY